jgi:para-nitrobenzyl esterase
VTFWHRGDPLDCPAEACITLGVWAPRARKFAADGTEILRPTVVSIHGGGMVSGDASACDRARRAKDVDAVQVSLNYRLGALGFLATPELMDESPLGIAGNYALLDLIEQLKWVKANIARFGGDPDNVTLVGHSAGATLSTYLMASPLSYPAEGRLFHRVLASSGAYQAGHVPVLPGLPNPIPSPVLNDPFERADALLTALESPCLQNNFGALSCAGYSSPLACLRAQPLSAIVQASASVSTHRVLRRSGIEEWWPVVDGYVLPQQPSEFVRDGVGEDRSVALLSGAAAVEGFQFNAWSADPANTEAEWLEELDVIANGDPTLPGLLQSIYAGLPVDLGQPAPVWGAYDALSGEAVFPCPSLSFAHAAAQAPGRTAPVHSYIFAYPNGFSTSAAPASHVPGSLFDVDPMGNDLLTLITCQPPTPADTAGQIIATRMRTALTNFVHGIPLAPLIWSDRRGGSLGTPDIAYFQTASPAKVSQQNAHAGRCIALEDAGLVYPSEPPQP